jgi:hypothetical protein
MPLIHRAEARWPGEGAVGQAQEQAQLPAGRATVLSHRLPKTRRPPLFVALYGLRIKNICYVLSVSDIRTKSVCYISNVL